jgi:hypothetical protein
MRKILVTLATVFGFLGLTALTLFFIMSPNQSFTPPSGTALTADISANFFGNDAAVPSTTESTTTIVALEAPTSSPTTTAATSPVAATPTTPTVTPSTPTPPPQSSTVPTDESQNTTAPSLPVATATITVTPTAPPPPPLLSPDVQTTPTSTKLSLPYDETDFSGDADWNATWGFMDTSDSGWLRLSAGPDSLGGAAYLQGAAGWTNYSMSATLDPVAGNTFDLMADYNDASNYVVCEYTVIGANAATMQLAQYIKGYRIDLTASTPVVWNGYGTDINTSMSVNGIYGSCSLGGKTVSNEGIGAGNVPMESPASGSVGIGINDPSPNTAQVILKDLKVVAD